MKPYPAFHRYAFMAYRRRTLTLVLVLSAFLPACSRPERPRVAAAPTLVRRLEEEVTTLNPICRTTLADRHVAQYLFTPLIYVDANLSPMPGLADVPSITPTGKVYRFRLDEKATFSDGRKVTASDVLFTMRRIVNAETRSRDSDAFVDFDETRTRIISPTEIELAFKEARPARLRRFADVLVVPEHVYGRGDFCRKDHKTAVGSGPYVLEYRDAGRITVVRREPYWRESPSIRRVTFKPIVDPQGAWRAVKAGAVDESYVPSAAWARERHSAAREHRLTFMPFYTARFTFLAWNLRRPALRDVRVRRALTMSFDASAVIRDVYEGTARIVTGPLPPELPEYESALRPVSYDPLEATRLFTAAGWRRNPESGQLEKDGVPLRIEVLCSATPSSIPRLLQTIRDALARVGVAIDIVTRDQATVGAQLEAGDYDAFFTDIDFNGDAELYPLFHSSQILPHGANYSAYQNPEVDRLLALARTEMDTARRQALHRRVHAIVAADQPYSWCIQVASKWAFASRIDGVATSPAKGLFLWYPGEFAWRIRD